MVLNVKRVMVMVSIELSSGEMLWKVVFVIVMFVILVWV